MKASLAHESNASVADAARERAKEYVDSGVDAYNALSEKTRAAGRHVDGYVRANPWLMIGAAAGVGVLIGMLIRRR